jgi:hypothetical protein
MASLVMLGLCAPASYRPDSYQESLHIDSVFCSCLAGTSDVVQASGTLIICISALHMVITSHHCQIGAVSRGNHPPSWRPWRHKCGVSTFDRPDERGQPVGWVDCLRRRCGIVGRFQGGVAIPRCSTRAIDVLLKETAAGKPAYDAQGRSGPLGGQFALDEFMGRIDWRGSFRSIGPTRPSPIPLILRKAS